MTARVEAVTAAVDPGLATDRSPRRNVVFAVVSLAPFMASVDQTIVATALSTMQHDLHAPINWGG
jgi:hypothetical protein